MLSSHPDPDQQLHSLSSDQPLHLALFEAGIASRRESLRLLTSGRVTIAGQPVTHFTNTNTELRNFTIALFNREKLNTTGDVRNSISGDHEPISFQYVKITLDGKTINLTPQIRRYVLIHKPRGTLCSCTKEHLEWTIPSVTTNKKKIQKLKHFVSPPLITTLIPSHISERLGHVGRLDLESEGLVFMTNDHSLIDGLLHPRRECSKQYEVIVLGSPSGESLEKLRRGAHIGNLGLLLPCKIDFLERIDNIPREDGGVGDRRGYTKFSVTLSEGKKNQSEQFF